MVLFLALDETKKVRGSELLPNCLQYDVIRCQNRINFATKSASLDIQCSIGKLPEVKSLISKWQKRKPGSYDQKQLTL